MMTVNGKPFPAYKIESAALGRQAASYQDRLHQATAVARAIRLGIPVAAVLYLAGRIVWETWDKLQSAEAGVFHGPESPAVLVYLVGGLFGAVLGGLVGGAAVSLPLAWIYRRLRARRLRRQLAMLEPRQLARVLYPLCGSEGELGTLAGRLIDDLRLDRMAAELLPADPPTGRGTEISAG